MRNYFIPMALTLLLLACNDDEAEMQNAIKPYLRFPTSAQFQHNFVMTENEKVACMAYRITNDIEMANQWSVALLSRASTPTWEVQDIDMDKTQHNACTDTLKRLDLIQK